MLSGQRAAPAPLRIKEAAALCGCSESKISKFTRKLGFTGYKHYAAFLAGSDQPQQQPPPKNPGELARLRSYLDGFDTAVASDLAKLIGAHKQVVLLGTGPSFQCAQYFEYRLRTCTDSVAIAAQDDFLAVSLTGPGTLLLVFSVTGHFRSYEQICAEAKRKGGDALLVLEQYDPALMQTYDKVICLGAPPQAADLEPFEKTRTAFFILMEEVIHALRQQRRAADVPIDGQLQGRKVP